MSVRIRKTKSAFLRLEKLAEQAAHEITQHKTQVRVEDGFRGLTV